MFIIPNRISRIGEEGLNYLCEREEEIVNEEKNSGERIPWDTLSSDCQKYLNDQRSVQIIILSLELWQWQYSCLQTQDYYYFYYYLFVLLSRQGLTCHASLQLLFCVLFFPFLLSLLPLPYFPFTPHPALIESFHYFNFLVFCCCCRLFPFLHIQTECYMHNSQLKSRVCLFFFFFLQLIYQAYWDALSDWNWKKQLHRDIGKLLGYFSVGR